MLEAWIAVVVTTVAATAAGVLPWWRSERQVVRRALWAARGVPIANATDGKLVKLVGTLRYGAERLRAPFSGRDCALYWVRVDMVMDSSTRVLEQCRMTRFFIEDASARALVEVDESPNVAIVVDAHFRSGLLSDPDPRIKEFVERHGIATKSGGLNQSLRYQEGVLEAGELVAVLGVAHWERDSEPDAVDGYRERSKRLRLVAPPHARLMLSDDASALGRPL